MVSWIWSVTFSGLLASMNAAFSANEPPSFCMTVAASVSSVPSFGCSALQVQTVDGMWLTSRNYDFKRDTSMMLVHCTPKDGYESIAFAALDNIGVVDPTTSLVKRLACLTTPFICLDGINSQGVTVSRGVPGRRASPAGRPADRICFRHSGRAGPISV